jgi:ABC-type taurine transport system ATPase subunit
MIRSERLPFTFHAMRVIVRNVLVLAHNLVVIVAVDALLDTWPGLTCWLALPGTALWLVDGLVCCLLLGAVCARFQDIPPIVGSVMQIAFFVSPIIWRPELLTSAHASWLPFNPFFTLLEVVRGPLLGAVPGWHVWLSASGYSAALCLVARLGFARVRPHLAFWVLGRVEVQGSIGALLDPNLGMNPELTGRENVALRGMLNGLTGPAIRRLEEDVQEFAEQPEFLDLPVRLYGSGMVIRLGFALVTAIRPEVLLMDECFLAGDAAFMKRARTRLEDMVRGADILVLSSHNADVIRSWSTRAMWLDQGRIVADGQPRNIVQMYEESAAASSVLMN